VSPLGTSPKNTNSFSLYAESSSYTRRGSIHSVNDSPRKLIDTSLSQAIELSRNFVPPKLGDTSRNHSRQNSMVVDSNFDPYTLLKIAPNVVKTRKGSVLARNTILKMDHFSSGTNTNLDFHLEGAPNFRVAELNVYGVAQPTVDKRKTVIGYR
jgi:hypothetical protein